MTNFNKFAIPDTVSKQLEAYTSTLNNLTKFMPNLSLQLPDYNLNAFDTAFDSLKIHTEIIAKQNELIQSTLNPIKDYMNSINKMINSTIKDAIPKINFEAFTSLNKISSFNEDFIETIDKSVIVEVIDEIYETIEETDFPNDFAELSYQCTDELSSIRMDLNTSEASTINIHQWIATIISILTLIVSILGTFDTSSEKVIEAQDKIIEYQSAQLEKLQSIDESLNKLVQPQQQDSEQN